MSGISSQAAGGKENKSKFGEKELQSKEFNDGTGLELYDFDARNLDPQIGRWHNLDPLADKAYSLTPFRYSFNNPMLFIDPDGRWEFQVGTRPKKDKDGKDTNETEKYLKLVKDDEKDDLKSLAEQTGLNMKDLKKLKLDLNKEITNLGDLLKFEIINEALNYTPEQSEDKNTCYEVAQEFASGRKITDDNTYPLKAVDAWPADVNLTKNFTNVEQPASGDYIRFAKPEGRDGRPADNAGGSSHAASFLLKNKKGMQVFTKNGTDAKSYEINYTNRPSPSIENNKSIMARYGNPTGLKGQTPYYRAIK